VTGPVTINGNGWAAITAPAFGNGITINAGGSDNVVLTGIEIDGAGTAYNGIVFNSGGSLTGTNCTLQNFVFDQRFDVTTGNVIVLQPTSGTLRFVIIDTTVSNNADAGIFYVPPSGSVNANGVIDRVVATANGAGITINSSMTSGGMTAVISNSVVSNNI